ncbi:hypothetical protein PCANC_06187 [Puccinia coronata f. sp. avenae]|uniref:Tet-like 2OG-Fe(II) oxygenase domain-containing protein n=1 Tax=Puccinia coronata f. sp. avenae TaxID=200324 RepID=A0A2N5VTH8_9BASI|nr:hypothetical protein PCANC_06187 [Puccinia coronata f. sp. avenae]
MLAPVSPGIVRTERQALAPVSPRIDGSPLAPSLAPVSQGIICPKRRAGNNTNKATPSCCRSTQIAALASAKLTQVVNQQVPKPIIDPHDSEMSGSELTSLGEEPLHTESVRSSSPSDFLDGKDSKQANKSSEVKPKQKRIQTWKQKKRLSASKQSSKPAGSAKLTAHQQQRRNKRVNERRKGKRETNRRKDFMTAPPLPGAHIVTRKMNPIDLFPEITHNFRQRYLEFQRQTAKHKKYPKRYPKPNQIFPRNPTNIENNKALETVKEDFYLINNNYNMIYDERTGKLVALAEFIHLDKLSESQRNDYNFLCLFLHQCKEFISPVASKSRSCGGVMWAIGWRKGYDGLEILGWYHDQEAIDKNIDQFNTLMDGSAQAGGILWNTFHAFGNVAIKKNNAYMRVIYQIFPLPLPLSFQSLKSPVQLQDKKMTTMLKMASLSFVI